MSISQLEKRAYALFAGKEELIAGTMLAMMLLINWIPAKDVAKKVIKGGNNKKCNEC